MLEYLRKISETLSPDSVIFLAQVIEDDRVDKIQVVANLHCLCSFGGVALSKIIETFIKNSSRSDCLDLIKAVVKSSTVPRFIFSSCAKVTKAHEDLTNSIARVIFSRISSKNISESPDVFEDYFNLYNAAFDEFQNSLTHLDEFEDEKIQQLNNEMWIRLRNKIHECR
ncbi:hypothetical protein ACOME3_003166 [Neoechinorhynchus agilis]